MFWCGWGQKGAEMGRVVIIARRCRCGGYKRVKIMKGGAEICEQDVSSSPLEKNNELHAKDSFWKERISCQLFQSSLQVSKWPRMGTKTS